MVSRGLVLDLVERVGAVARHDTVSVPIPDGDTETARRTVTAWCARTGNELVEITDGSVVVRRGPSVDHLAELDPTQVPGTRLWIYTNFDCNLPVTTVVHALRRRPTGTASAWTAYAGSPPRRSTRACPSSSSPAVSRFC